MPVITSSRLYLPTHTHTHASLIIPPLQSSGASNPPQHRAPASKPATYKARTHKLIRWRLHVPTSLTSTLPAACSSGQGAAVKGQRRAQHVGGARAHPHHRLGNLFRPAQAVHGVVLGHVCLWEGAAGAPGACFIVTAALPGVLRALRVVHQGRKAGRRAGSQGGSQGGSQAGSQAGSQVCSHTTPGPPPASPAQGWAQPWPSCRSRSALGRPRSRAVGRHTPALRCAPGRPGRAWRPRTGPWRGCPSSLRQAAAMS